MLLRYKEAILCIIFMLVVFVFAVLKTYPQIGNIISIEKNIVETSTQTADLQRKLDALQKADQDQKALESIQTKKIYKPEGSNNSDAETSFSIIFDDVIDMAKYNGIKIYSIEYNYNPPEDDFVKNASQQYNVCQLNMSIIVDYQDLQSFLRDLFKYPYLINIQKLEMVPYPKNKKILLTTLQIKLYTETPAVQATTTNAAAPAQNGATPNAAAPGGATPNSATPTPAAATNPTAGQPQPPPPAPSAPPPQSAQPTANPSQQKH